MGSCVFHKIHCRNGVTANRSAFNRKSRAQFKWLHADAPFDKLRSSGCFAIWLCASQPVLVGISPSFSLWSHFGCSHGEEAGGFPAWQAPITILSRIISASQGIFFNHITIQSMQVSKKVLTQMGQIAVSSENAPF